MLKVTGANLVERMFPAGVAGCSDPENETMISPEFDFGAFIKAVKDADFVEITRIAEREMYNTRSMSFGVRGAAEARKRGSAIYAMQLQLFLYFVRYRIIPANIDQQTLSYLRPVAENLVAKGQFKPTVLEMFAATD